MIHSRSLSTYHEQDHFFTQLDAFLEAHPNSDITIISVLPRLLPSQYDTFLWQGIDGSKIKSYILTAQNDTGKPSVIYSYSNGETNAKMISGTYKRYQQKNLSDEVLLTFGHGDGGGGPSILQLEYLNVLWFA